MSEPIERCCDCDDRTGHAGKDSLYCKDCGCGPFCHACYGVHVEACALRMEKTDHAVIRTRLDRALAVLRECRVAVIVMSDTDKVDSFRDSALLGIDAVLKENE